MTYSLHPSFSALSFSEPNKPWYALVAARATEHGPQDTLHFVGVSDLGVAPGNKATGELNWQVTIAGYALPATANVTSVTLNGNPVAYEVNDTHRGREVTVSTDSSHPLEVIITTQ
jgi:hypothetical protein